MATGTSKMLLPEPFTGSNDIESYITHFELLANLQNWVRTETREGNDVQIDDRPHYFALRLQKSAIDFYRTLTDAQKPSYDELKKAFRTHYTEKPVVFRGQLARRTQSPGEKLTDFLGDLQGLAMKAYPGESKEIRDHSQVRLDLRVRKTIGDAEMNIERILEMALQLEAVTRIEEEGKKPDNNERLINSVNQLIEKLCLSRDSRNDHATVFRKGNNTEEVIQEIVIETETGEIEVRGDEAEDAEDINADNKRRVGRKEERADPSLERGFQKRIERESQGIVVIDAVNVVIGRESVGIAITAEAHSISKNTVLF